MNSQFLVLGAPFEKTDACVDIVSIDPGLSHGAISHIRVDKANAKCCILHTNMFDVLDVHDCFAYSQGVPTGRRRKPKRAEPFTSAYPSAPDQPLIDEMSDEQRRRIDDMRALKDAGKLKDLDRIPLIAWKLSLIKFVNSNDIDVVLVEVQDPTHRIMPSVANAFATYFETKNALRRQSRPAIHRVSSRLKLSDPILDILSTHFAFVDDERAVESKSTLNFDVTRGNHDANKKSVVKVFEMLGDERDFSETTHRFFEWMRKQRAERHNVLDSLLQAWSWCIENGIGFSDHLLSDVRKSLRKSKTRARARVGQKRQRTETENHNEPATNHQDVFL